jgi:diadenylate cyclase
LNVNDWFLLGQVILDIAAVTFLIYSGLRIIRNNSRTIQIFKGILVVLVIKLAANFLGFSTLSYLIDIFLNWGVVAVLIVFQPEIRSMLERVGKTSAIFSNNVSVSQIADMVDQLTIACTSMSKSKTGALITIQMNQSLQDYIETGITMDAEVSAELLNTIFQYGTPMHDGAVIIQGVKIACAAAYFPPTSKDLPSRYGARHRAAVGISEITDSITIIVSEETGDISLAIRGQLTKYSPEALKRTLMNKLAAPEEEKSSVFTPVVNTARNLGINIPTKQGQKASARKDERVMPIEVVDLYTGGRHEK